MSWLDWIFEWIGSFFRSAPPGSLVAKIQAATVQACGFLPTAETVVALIAANNPAANMAVTIARKICVAVSQSQSVSTLVGTEKPKPMVDGVVIEGEFIK